LFPGKTASKRKAPAKTTTAPKAKLLATVEPLTPDQWAEARQAAKDLGPGSFSGFKLTAMYPYRLANGKAWGWRARYESKDGEKQIKPFHHNGTQWILKEAKAPRPGKPLYRLPE